MQVKDLRLKRALRTALLVLLLNVVGMGKMYAQNNLIVNPDFESGNTGFYSDYTYVSSIVEAGQYAIDNTTTGHGIGSIGWPTILGYGGSGKYMLVNGFGGTTNPTKVVWKQTVTVTPNTDYIFSCQVVNLAQSVFGYSPNPAILRLKINGSTVGGDYTVAQNNSWHEWTVSWSNGSATQAEIAIYDVYTGDSGLGDDFGLDHLSLTPQATYSVNAVDDDVSLCVAYMQTYQIDVLANDIITPNGQISGATVQIIQAPAHGNATWNNTTRKVNYMFLDQGYYGGLDQFKYRVTIPHGESADAWVYVNTGREPNVGWIDPPGTICAGGPLGISIPTVEPDQGSGQWECSQSQSGSFTAFDENNVPLSMNGWYVRYTATNDCGSGSSNTVQISVTNGPSFTGQTPQIPPICAGNSLNLTPLAFNTNGSTITNQGWVVSQTENGTYNSFSLNNIPSSYNGWYVCYMVESSCGPVYSNPKRQLVVNDVPTIATITSPQAIYAGNSFNLTTPTIQNNGSIITSQGWQIAAQQNGSYTAFNNNNVPYSYNGYWIRYFAENDCGIGYSNSVQITVYQNDNIIIFADANVKAICVANWDTDGDGELSYEEAAAVTDLGQVFRENIEITSFEELQYFTGLTNISSSAFFNCSNLTGNLTIPNSVTMIGSYAFYYCSGLTGELIIPNSVITIGDYAFYNCSGFTGSLTIGNSVTTIGDYAFDGCSDFIGDLIIPNSVTTIGDYAFDGCSGFNGSLTIPNSVTKIGISAFRGCSGFTGSLTIPDSVTEIGSAAFRNCTGFDGSLTLGNSLTTIGDRIFYGCSGFTGSLIIPSFVTSIGDFAFSGCSGFTGNLIIPDSVTYLSGFDGCTGLTGELIIPNSVSSIGYMGFYGCSGFTGSLTIPNSVTEIGINAFCGCSGFTSSLTIPNSVTSIGNGAFSGCSGLTGSLTIPNSVTSIGASAFYGCSGLTGSLTIPNSVTSIGADAFNSCSGFTGSLTIPNSVTSIGADAFFGCSGFNGNLTISNSVTTIGNYAFTFCSGFTGSLVIPNSVTSIGADAFFGCSGFNGNLTIPNSVTTIGNYAFAGCSGLSTITVLAETPPTLDSNVFYNLDTFIPVYVPCGFDEVYASLLWGGFGNFMGLCAGEITVTVNPTGGGTVTGTGYYEGGTLCTLTAIPNEGFSFLNWMENGTIVSNDSEYSFVVSGDRELVANFVEGELCTVIFELFDSYGDGYTGNYLVVTDENGSQQLTVESGSSAVYTLSFLTGSHITLTWIFGSYPEDCSFTVSYSNGSMIYHGENLNESFNYEFDVDCNSAPIGNIVFADPNVKALCVANWDTDGDGELSYDEAAAVTDLGQVFYYKTGITSFNELQYFRGLASIGRQAFQGCSGLTSIVIPNSVVSISFCAFYDCTGLTSIMVPNSVTSIGSVAFGGCCLLSSIDIPNSVTSIGESAFSNCTGLTSIDIPNSVTSIEFNAFWRCTSLTTITIPSSVTSMGENPFAGCSGLEQIIVDSGNTAYDSRENSNAIIETSTNILISGCKNTVIPNSVSSIGFSAFNGCSDLTSIVIPNSVTTIDNFAFVNCSNMTSISMSNSLTSIGHYAFWYCSGLTSIDIPNSVTFIDGGAFESCNGLTTVTVPNSVTSIGSNPFGDCDSLEQIIVDSGNTVYDSRKNCNAIIETNTNVLISGCKNTVIPNSVTSIGFSAFYGCSDLVSIGIPNSVTYIDYEAFNYCDGLTTLTIPFSVTSISYWAFHGCSGLTSITVLADTPPVLDDDVFYDVSIGIPVYVPYNTISAYQTASHWSEFTNYQEICYKTILGYGEGEGNYRFIASPLVENTAPTMVDNMITEMPYDLYRFDQSEDAEWQNYKVNNFNLTNGQGYLYANAEEVNVIFKGEFNEDETKEVELAYDANADFAGWNLVGNPFPISAYANKSYYTMNEDGTGIEPNAVSSATAIPACTGVMVKADDQGETVVFNTTAPETASNKGGLRIALSQVVDRGGVSTGSTTAVDKAIVSFNAGDRLEKYVFNKDNARISIPQGGKDLAIAYAEHQGEMPLNFKATKNGTYTLSVDVEKADVDYLHLIDNLTGADVDLLALRQAQGPAEYTFTAKTTDYASRFRLVFNVNEMDGPSTGSGTFAFISNGNIIVTDAAADAVLQIVDVTGCVLVSRKGDAMNRISTNGMTPGVYVLRLINGNDIKTQKIVID